MNSNWFHQTFRKLISFTADDTRTESRTWWCAANSDLKYWISSLDWTCQKNIRCQHVHLFDQSDCLVAVDVSLFGEEDRFVTMIRKTYLSNFHHGILLKSAMAYFGRLFKKASVFVFAVKMNTVTNVLLQMSRTKCPFVLVLWWKVLKKLSFNRMSWYNMSSGSQNIPVSDKDFSMMNSSVDDVMIQKREYR